MPFQSKTGTTPTPPNTDITALARTVLNKAGRNIDAAFRSLTLDTLLVRGNSQLKNMTASGITKLQGTTILKPPGSTKGPPTTGGHNQSEIYVDNLSGIWICTGSGTPGTWRYVGSGGYKARMYLASAQSIANGVDSIVLNFDTKDYDPATMLTTGANAKFTAPFAGIWCVNYQAGFPAWGAGAGTFFLSIFINGNTAPNGSTHDSNRQSVAASSGSIFANISAQMNLNSGDVVQGAIFQNSGGAINSGNGSAEVFFSVFYVGN